MKDEEQILKYFKTELNEKSTQNDETKASLMAMTYYEAFDMKGSSELKKNVEQQIRTALSEQVPETSAPVAEDKLTKTPFTNCMAASSSWACISASCSSW